MMHMSTNSPKLHTVCQLDFGSFPNAGESMSSEIRAYRRLHCFSWEIRQGCAPVLAFVPRLWELDGLVLFYCTVYWIPLIFFTSSIAGLEHDFDCGPERPPASSAACQNRIEPHFQDQVVNKPNVRAMLATSTP